MPRYDSDKELCCRMLQCQTVFQLTELFSLQLMDKNLILPGGAIIVDNSLMKVILSAQVTKIDRTHSQAVFIFSSFYRANGSIYKYYLHC